MKTFKFAMLLFLAVICFSPQQTTAQYVSINFSTFQRELSPHGRWMNNPRFGQVWIYNAPGFRPYYTDGHWEYTDYGWAWVSDFDWGWAPFHYGRWEYDNAFGWMWIPGYEWGSAWVSWSAYDDYYGWAPLGYGMNANTGFSSIAYNNWTFIPRANICDRDINRHYISPERNAGFRNAVIINNYYDGRGNDGRFMRGPERKEVERFTHNTVTERKIEDRDRHGGQFIGSNHSNNVDRSLNNNNNNVQPEHPVVPEQRQVNSSRPAIPGHRNYQPAQSAIPDNNRQNEIRAQQNNDQRTTFPQKQIERPAPVTPQRQIERSSPVMPQRNIERNNRLNNIMPERHREDNNSRGQMPRSPMRRG